MKALCIGNKGTFQRLMDENACYDILRECRWPDGIVNCPYCRSTDVSGPWVLPWEPACYRYHCYSCEMWFNDRSGTIFDGSKLPLSAWFLIMYLVELGKTTAQIAKEIPCHYDTVHRIVWLLREREIKVEEGRHLSGIIEVDEIYQTAGHKGGRPADNPTALNRPARCRGKKKGPGRGSAQKDSPVIEGMVSRQGEVVVEVLPDVKEQTLRPVFEKRVEKGSAVYTDSASCYSFLEEAGYKHETVNHSQKEYVRGDVHENRCESLWLQWLIFILPFQGVAQRNLPAYAKVFQFRRNHRNLNAYGRVMFVMNLILEEDQKQLSKFIHFVNNRIFFLHPGKLTLLPIRI
jgi:transposase-like protein